MRVLLMVGVAVVCGGCASTTARPHPFPQPGRPSAETPSDSLPNGGVGPVATRPVRTGGYEISGTALSLRGTPYRNGGADPNGFDCSGLVWYVFTQHGVSVPRTVGDQFKVGGNVSPADLRPGDLVFFSTTAAGASHVGIAVGGDAFVHAPSSSGTVRVERLAATYWGSRFIGARRVTP
ncbi:MAG: C40 family peptidase [Acidobacteria bacterium]|nr:C40 family peptidase [Acidobacteriota bacterium]